MDAATTRSVKKLGAAAAIFDSLAEIGAQEYANGKFRAKPIVDRHFTAGNQQRYGWPDLSEDYAEAKRGQRKALQRGMKATGRKVSKPDEDRFGSSILPMLVRTGRLREAITSRTHKIIRQGDTAIIVFANLPAYALAHHTGAGRLPKRSPVEPNAEDVEAVAAAMRRALDPVLGTGGDVAVSGGTVPGRARFT